MHLNGICKCQACDIDEGWVKLPGFLSKMPEIRKLWNWICFGERRLDTMIAVLFLVCGCFWLISIIVTMIE